MSRNLWKDKNGKIRCDGCGKVLSEKEVHLYKSQGYCSKCYADIIRYNQKHKSL